CQEPFPMRLYPESGFLLEICGENRDGRTLTGDLRMTKRGRRRTIREKPLGFVVPFLGRWAAPSRPGIDAGSPERPRPVRSPPVATPEPRSRGFSVWGFRRKAQAPTARNPVNGVATLARGWWATRRQRRPRTTQA